MKICWVKILTAVVGGSTDAYVMPPPPKGCGGTCEAYDVVTYTLQLASSCIFHI